MSLAGESKRHHSAAVEGIFEGDDAGRLVYARRSLTAFSTASAPLFRKNVFFGNLPE